MSDEIKQKTISGFFWRFAERISAQLVSFIVSVILARLLLPEEFGIIALVNIFISIANVFITSGFGTALIQKKDADELDFNTIFFSSLLISIFLYFCIFFSSPLIAKIYKTPQIISVLRIMGIRLPLSCISSIQNAIVSRKMIFRKFFFATIIGTFVSAIIGIYMAYNGFGVWALVVQNLSNLFIDTLVLGITVRWFPKIMFSFERFKSLFSYGSKILFATLLGVFCDKLRGLLIGGKYTKEELAFYNRGEHIPCLISDNINSTFESVLFPALSKYQDDKEKLKAALRRSLKLGSYIVFPILIGLAVVSDKLIVLLYTEKWSFAIPFVKIVCFQCIWGIANTINMQAIKAIGRSDILLKLEFIKKPTYLIILFGCSFFNPLAIAIGCSIYSLIALFINSFPNKKLLNYSIWEQLRDISQSLIISILMGLIVYLIGLIKIPVIFSLILQIICGIIVYISFSIIIKSQDFIYIINFLKEKFSKKV